MGSLEWLERVSDMLYDNKQHGEFHLCSCGRRQTKYRKCLECRRDKSVAYDRQYHQKSRAA